MCRDLADWWPVESVATRFWTPCRVVHSRASLPWRKGAAGHQAKLWSESKREAWFRGWESGVVGRRERPGVSFREVRAVQFGFVVFKEECGLSLSVVRSRLRCFSVAGAQEPPRA